MIIWLLSQSILLTHPSPYTVACICLCVCLVRILRTCSLSNCQAYNRVLLTVVLVLYIKSPELIYLTTESWLNYFLKAIEENHSSLVQFLESTQILKSWALLCFQASSIKLLKLSYLPLILLFPSSVFRTFGLL